MKTTLKTAISLLRKDPALWVPVILATSFSQGLTLLRKWLTHKLILAFVTVHSVLDGAPSVDYSRLTSPRLQDLITLIGWFSEFLVICFFAVALVVTARKALGITAAKFPVSGVLFLPLLWFSVKFQVVYHLFLWLLTVPLGFMAYLYHQAFQAFHPYQIPLVTCVQLLFTLIVAAMAIRLLARVLHRHATESAIRSARILAILAAIVFLAIAYLVPRIEHPLFAHWPQMSQFALQTVVLAGNVLSTLPFTVLFVSLALLLSEEAPEDASSPDQESAPEPAPSES